MELSRSEWLEKGRAIVVRQLSMMDRSRRQLDEAMAKRYTELGLIDDAHFADALVQTRLAGAGTSRRVIAEELRRKGIDADIVEAAVGVIDDAEELGTATRLALKRLERGSGDRASLQQRVYAALTRRGFSHDVCSTALRQANELLGAEDSAASWTD